MLSYGNSRWVIRSLRVWLHRGGVAMRKELLQNALGRYHITIDRGVRCQLPAYGMGTHVLPCSDTTNEAFCV
jgi:hypothetical protein